MISAYNYTTMIDDENRNLTESVLLVFLYLHDIIHLHIYTFVFFIVYKNIDEEYFNKFIKNITILLTSHILLIPTLLETFLKDDSPPLIRIINIWKYIIILEFIAYWYHRLAHIKIFYNHIHSHKFIGTSYNYFLRSKCDVLAQIIYTYLPLKLVPMNYNDFMIIYGVYVFHGFLSNIHTHSKIHKEIRKYNYGLGLPIYDYIFGTYLSEKQFSKLRNDS